MQTEDKKDIYWQGKIYQGVPDGESRYNYPSVEVHGSHSFKDLENVTGKYQLKRKSNELRPGLWAYDMDCVAVAVGVQEEANAVHNLFMENARVWDEEYAWCMDIDTFKRIFPSPSSTEAVELLREVVMRGNLCFPETEQDLEWFEEGLKKQHDLFLDINKILGLGKVDEIPESFK